MQTKGMSTASEGAGDPQRLLADTRELARRVRRAQRGSWSALLVLGGTVLLAIPFYRYGGYVLARCQASADGRIVCARYPALAFWYWPAALVVAYALIGAIFVRRARSHGVGARVRPYVVAGIVLVAVATLITIWHLQHPLSGAELGGPLLLPGSAAGARLYRLVGPLGVIGLGLLVLARMERSRALAAFTVVYLVAVLATTPAGLHAGRLGPWAFLPGIVVPGLVLLAGSAVFAVLERPATPGAP
jgi:hypothetical protein